LLDHISPEVGTDNDSCKQVFCSNHLEVRLRLPYDTEAVADSPEYLKPGMEMELSYGSVRPLVVEEALSTRRVLRFANRIEARLNGAPIVVVRPADVPDTADQYDADLLAIEQFAYDLDVVQRHTSTFFNIPEELRPGDRVSMRVARLLVEGHIVASPRAPQFTLAMTGVDTPEVRGSLQRPRSIVWPAGPYSVSVAGRDMVIGDVYAVHPSATAVNGDDAIAALDAGVAQGFQVEFRPGDDHYFYVTLADVPPDEAVRRAVSEWSLYGVDQPDTVRTDLDD
jgi:hypothetical protein